MMRTSCSRICSNNTARWCTAPVEFWLQPLRTTTSACPLTQVWEAKSRRLIWAKVFSVVARGLPKHCLEVNFFRSYVFLNPFPR
uniref:Ij1 n=1 Tax=Arundo donax TaxID=35708 RepID=A0A0A9D1E9_ARUDO